MHIDQIFQKRGPMMYSLFSQWLKTTTDADAPVTGVPQADGCEDCIKKTIENTALSWFDLTMTRQVNQLRSDVDFDVQGLHIISVMSISPFKLSQIW